MTDGQMDNGCPVVAIAHMTLGVCFKFLQCKSTTIKLMLNRGVCIGTDYCSVFFYRSSQHEAVGIKQEINHPKKHMVCLAVLCQN